MRFAEVDGLGIAWQQFGEGPNCLVIPPLVSNIEMYWENEMFRRVLECHGQHMRVTHFDKRGIGLSDRSTGEPTWEQRIGDIVCVMDAAGLERAHIFGISEGGLMAQLFAARHPERVDRLVVANSVVVGRSAWPDAAPAIEAKWKRLIQDWGRDARFFVQWFSPSNAANESFVRWWARLQRHSATQAEAAHQIENVVRLTTMTTEFLADIEAPTLVANSSRDQVNDPRSGDFLAREIPHAERVLLDNDDHFFFLGDHWLEAMSTIIEFMTGFAPPERIERCFASVVFTDIVGSTATTAAVGDAAWRAALDEHDRIAWATSGRHAGTIVKSTGDGLLVRFDSPHAAIGFCRDLRTELDEAGLRIRAGIHAGEIEVRANKDIAGIAVNLAARVEQSTPDGAIYVSSTVRDMLLGGATQFEDRGEHVLKGLHDPWKLYELSY